MRLSRSIKSKPNEKFAKILTKKGLSLNKFISDKNDRLDIVLSLKLQTSRSQICNLIKSKFVQINEKIITKPSFMVKFGDEISYILPNLQKPQKQLNLPKFNIEIIYEDDDILVINKPSGLVVHEAPSVKEPTLVDWLKANDYELSTLNGEFRAGIVHRLDKGTSGAMVVAKNNISAINLSEQLSTKLMGRIYLMITDLALKQNCIINRPIGRNNQNRLKKAIVENGRAAKSAFANIFLDEDYQNTKFTPNLVAAKLFTGRTHQIRVHLGSINRHILGDDLYGYKGNNDKIKRILLHAYLLKLNHPKTNEQMQFIAPLPAEFDEILQKENINEKINPNLLCDIFEHSDEWLSI